MENAVAVYEQNKNRTFGQPVLIEINGQWVRSKNAMVLKSNLFIKNRDERNAVIIELDPFSADGARSVMIPKEFLSQEVQSEFTKFLQQQESV